MSNEAANQPTPMQGRGSSDDATAVRDALCTRIRSLGAGILAITRAAMKKVEEMDAETAAAAAPPPQQPRKKNSTAPRQQQRKSATAIKTPPKVKTPPPQQQRQNPNASRSSGTPSPPPSSKDQRKHTTTSQKASSPSHSPSPSRIAPAAASSADKNNNTSKGAAAKRGGSAPAGGAAKQAKKTPSRAVSMPAAQQQQPPAQQHHPKNRQPRVVVQRRSSAQSSDSKAAAAAAATAAAAAAASAEEDEDAKQVQQASPKASENNNSGVSADEATLREAAEERFQLMLAHQRHRSEADLHTAPLYDCSNAAATADAQRADPLYPPPRSPADESTNNNTATQAELDEAEGVSVNTTIDKYAEGMTAGGGQALSARSAVEARELSQEEVDEIVACLQMEDGRAVSAVDAVSGEMVGAEEAASVLLTPSPPTNNYYRVVYIHQSTRQAARKASGSPAMSSPAASPSSAALASYSASRTGLLRRRLTPHLADASTGRSSPAPTSGHAGGEEDGLPPMVNSYVRAMYAVDHNVELSPQEQQQPQPRPLEPIVQVQLRIPPQNHRAWSGSVGAISNSRASTPSTGMQQNFALVDEGIANEAAMREAAAGVDPVVVAAVAGGRGSGEPHELLYTLPPVLTEESAKRTAVTTAVEEEVEENGAENAAGEGDDEEKPNGDVEATIESIEGWRRDRETSVEDNIRRRRRRSSFAVPGWQGEYYYYSATSPEAAAALSLAKGGGASSASGRQLFPSISVSRSSAAAAAAPTSDAAAGELLPSSSLCASSPGAAAPLPLAMARLVSPTSAVPITYDVLLQTRQSASVSSTPRSPLGGTASQLQGKERKNGAEGAALNADAVVAAENNTAEREDAENGRVAKELSGAAAATHPLATPPLISPVQRPISAGRKRRHYPRLEVVVASEYNSMEWAFAGAARRASGVSDEATTATTAAAERQGERAADDHGIDAPPRAATPISPLWVAHQHLELLQEEQRRTNAQTRQPHGLDIQAPITVHVPGV